tara:strand:+ start:2808 stop:3398 length:591 start_codon:yes stop_codon:yes gene_type:complete
MDLPILEMSVEGSGDVGIKCMSLVNSPAIQVGWIAFEEHQVKFAIENEDERIVFGAVLIPDQKIYRKDERMGEYYVTATAKSIRAIREQFFKSQNTTQVNTEHKGGKVDAFLLESFISDSSKGISNPKPFETLPDGTWFVGYKIEDEKIWNDVKTGKFLGFSLEGNFNLTPVNLSEEERLIFELTDFIESKLNSLK